MLLAFTGVFCYEFVCGGMKRSFMAGCECLMDICKCVCVWIKSSLDSSSFFYFSVFCETRCWGICEIL